jgi:amino acid permease
MFFSWFYNLTTTAGFITWLMINVTFVFFHRGMKAQGYDLRSNVYNNRFQPYFAYWGIFWSTFFILTSGYAVFYKFNVSDFMVAYVNIAIFVVLFVGYKVVKKTKVWKPMEMDFTTVGFFSPFLIELFLIIFCRAFPQSKRPTSQKCHQRTWARRSLLSFSKHHQSSWISFRHHLIACIYLLSTYLST